MHVRANKVKSIWKSGGTIYSSSVRLPEPGLCEILGYAGFDFVLIDGEHGAMDPTSVDRLVLSGPEPLDAGIKQPAESDALVECLCSLRRSLSSANH